MKSMMYWFARVGPALALMALLAGCGTAPAVQSQSGSVGDTRQDETTALDQTLLTQVDQQLATARANGSDVTSAQKMRDSAVGMAQAGNYAEANGNLKVAAQLLGVLRPIGDVPTAAPAPVIAAAPLPASTGDEQGPLVLNATLDSATNLDSWQRVGPRIPTGTPLWEIQDNMLVQRGVDGIDAVDEQTGLVTGDPAWSNVTVKVNAMARDTRELGLIVRQQGESYYRFRALIVGTGTNQGNYILEKVVNGEVTRLAAFDGSELPSDTWHTLAVTANGSSLRCYVNGKLVGSADDSTLTAGRAGVSSLAMSGAFFKNLQVNGG
jgi:hypothetical protein